MAKLKKSGQGASWFLTVFGGIFLAVGLLVGAFQVRNMVKSVQAHSWADASATVKSAELDVNYDSDGGNTYRARGSYQYDWNGVTYTSDRLFYGAGYDSQDKYHRKIVRTLKSKMRSGDPLTVKVNPRSPEKSVAFPAIRWGMTFFLGVFSLLFGGVGAGIIFMGRYAFGMTKRENIRKDQVPDEPWLWKDEWQSPAIKNQSRGMFYMSAFFALFWNLISWPAIILSWEEIFEKGNYLALLVFLFPAIGIGLLVWAWKTFRQWKRFGRTELYMDTFPAPLGQALLARLRLYINPPPDAEFHVKLNCIREEERGSGDDRRTVEVLVWQDEQLISANQGTYSDVFELPIRFAIPENQPPSSIDDTGFPYIWRVTVKAEAGFTDLDQRFDVPVFDPKAYKFKIPIAAQLRDGEGQNRMEYPGDWQRTGVVYSDDGNGHYYFFPAARHKGIAAMTLFLGLIFGGVGIAPFFTDMSFLFGFVFGLFALLLLFWSLTMWLHKSAVDIADGIMTVRRGFFRGRYKDIPVEQVKRLELDSTMSSGETKYYDINVRLKSGDKLKVADHLLGRRDALDLMRKISAELGLTPDQLSP